MSTFIGIDFSGGARPWKEHVREPTVWLAFVGDLGDRLSLNKLLPVQALEGNGSAFDRLVALLAAGAYEVAAIDAPFSLPVAHLPQGSHSELILNVRALPNGLDRPFPTGASIVTLGEMVAPKTELKPLRQTETYWKSRGVNTRSTMWNGPRGGAPFAAACLCLIERSQRPCWPWSEFQPGILCEAFPAAQLHHWGLPCTKYSGFAGQSTRERIFNGIRNRLVVNAHHAETILRSADALDAVVATFAAVAVAKRSVVAFDATHPDGFIAVAP
jgi:hypothetical protein